MADKEHDDIKHLIEETLKLEKENNKLLRKLNRYSWIGLIMRLLWYALLVGLPFVLYFYLLEPYFNMFGSSYEEFRQGVAELPGFKALLLFIDAVMGN